MWVSSMSKYSDLIVEDLENAKVTSIIRKEINSNKKYIRIWKLGNLEYKIMPTKAAFEKLQKALEEWDGVSTLDIIWGPDLTLEVFEIDNSEEIKMQKEQQEYNQHLQELCLRNM
jgi:hypothetical protein